MKPNIINSHTGRDYFSLEQNLELIDLAQETHRGRVGYSPQMTKQVFDANKNFMITADLSHWVCVTESFLENFSGILSEAIVRTKHAYADRI